MDNLDRTGGELLGSPDDDEEMTGPEVPAIIASIRASLGDCGESDLMRVSRAVWNVHAARIAQANQAMMERP